MWFIIYVVSLYALWEAIDLKANTFFASGVAPFTFFIVLVVFLLWLSTKVKVRSGSSSGVGGGSFLGGGGDSCGGGGDGGGGC